MRQILTSATPGSKIAFLFLFLLIGVITAGALSHIILMIPGPGKGDELYSIYVVSALQSLFTIAMPALLVAAMTHPRPLHYLKIEKNGKMLQQVFFALLLFVFSYLGATFLSQWNSGMVLPESMSGIEQKMRSMEDAAMETTTLLLSVDTIGGLLLNLLIVAGFAAVSEELFFRGALQQFLQERFHSGHAAVWLAALIFSLVHFQFYGFIPRLFLGALLGYLLLYTQNLWIPVIFHFINNATVIVLHFFWGDAEWFNSLDEMPLTPLFTLGAIVSALLSFLLFWMYAQRNTKTRQQQEKTNK